MTERERDESQTNADPTNLEVERTNRGPAPEPKDARTPTDQAIINEERELDSGEENVV
jgi:hypothetical protein